MAQVLSHSRHTEPVKVLTISRISPHRSSRKVRTRDVAGRVSEEVERVSSAQQCPQSMSEKTPTNRQRLPICIEVIIDPQRREVGDPVGKEIQRVLGIREQLD